MTLDSHITAHQKEPVTEPHPVAIPELRFYAYAKKLGEAVPVELAEHLAQCTQCEYWLKILHRTDPVLNGEDEMRVKQLIRDAENKVEEAPLPTFLPADTTVGASANKAIGVFRQLFGRVAKRGVEHDLLKAAEEKADKNAA